MGSSTGPHPVPLPNFLEHQQTLLRCLRLMQSDIQTSIVQSRQQIAESQALTARIDRELAQLRRIFVGAGQP